MESTPNIPTPKKSPSIFGASLFMLAGGFAGLFLGMLAINFFPDTCTTQGITTTCGTPFEFLGFAGYNGTALLGVLIGAVIGLLGYLMISRRKM